MATPEKVQLTNSQINLPYIFFNQKYFFHDNPTWNINYFEQVFQVGTQSTYSWQKVVGKKVGKNGIGIDKFDVELTKWN